MRRPSAILLTAFLGIVLSGGSLGLLQVVAWTGMLAARVQTASVSEAFATTFDGHHPCALCQAIQDHRNDQVIAMAEKFSVKGLLDCGRWTPAPALDPVASLASAPVQVPAGRGEPPPLPPPRI